LHDDISQQLGLLALDLQRLLTGMSESVARTGIDAALHKLGRIIAGIHGVSRRLHPSIVRDLGPAAAINAESQHFESQHGIPVHFTSHAPVGELSEENGLTLFRIVQEEHNVAKHAHASDVHVSLDRLADKVPAHRRLWRRIRPTPAARRLRSGEHEGACHTRAWDLAIRSTPGRSTLIEAMVPTRLPPEPAPIA
jgi:hypothetical protein